MPIQERLARIFSNPEAYREALKQLRAEPDIANLGLGPQHTAHSLDQIVSLKWPKQLDEDQYKYQHVEYLLDQAADLLDRGFKDRSQWEELYEKWLRNVLEVYELLAIDDVQRREEQIGIFEVPSALASGEEAANAESTKRFKMANDKFSNIAEVQLKKDQREWLAERRTLLGIIGAFPHLTNELGPYQGVLRAQIQTLVDDAAKGIAVREIEIEHTSFEAQGCLANASMVAGEKRADGLKRKAEFEKENVILQKERRSVTRNVVAAKQLASSLDGGALNFAARMEPIQTRYENDFREALARIQVAAKGLKLLYGYPEPTPDPSGARFFDECLIWVREAISFLVRVHRLDQSYVLAFSLKRLCDADWARDRDAGVLKFALRDEHFPKRWKQRLVRLRGFNAFVSGDAAKGTWPIVVTPPRSSFCLHADGTKADLDQRRASPCLAGRVSGRDAIEQADILGTIEFFHLSPFEDWEVQIPPKSIEGIESSKIEDIHLDLHLTARVLP